MTTKFSVRVNSKETMTHKLNFQQHLNILVLLAENLHGKNYENYTFSMLNSTYFKKLLSSKNKVKRT